ncbi:MAG: hypothetical protein O2960_09040 [Verrucomicrobia bacterium]|nr:hypothetical protein [Verrucomicrobiota bacterium]
MTRSMVVGNGKTMPRKVRVEYPGAIYHIMSRGDRREDIFHDEVDRQDFLKTLAEACLKAETRRRERQSKAKTEMNAYQGVVLL